MEFAIYEIGKMARRLVIAGCAVLFVTGCATDPFPRGSRFVVSAPFAEFYKNGPAGDMNLDVAQHRFENYLLEQHTGPDFQLPKGAVVTLLKWESGYSKVITDSGIVGYVANEKLKPVPRVAQAVPAGMQPERDVRDGMRAIPPSGKSGEQLDLGNLPLPLPS